MNVFLFGNSSSFQFLSLLAFCLKGHINPFVPFNFVVSICSICSSSLGKKYLMALSGFVLVGFVFVHMAGNLQMFAGAEAINTYAYQLKALPWFVLWGSRLFLLVAVVVHAWTAAKICAENRASRPASNDVEVTKKSGWASLNMGLTGSILFA
ncbi:MAG: hypothetical protein HOB63_11645, partial [Opitutae bacterium]|nr:hypothetical protein [Opitutae bacterium]